MYVIEVGGGKIMGNKQYIKYTSDAREFGGRIRLTDDLSQAKQFTRKRDADTHACMIEWRCVYKPWDSDKYGAVECKVLEIETLVVQS